MPAKKAPSANDTSNSTLAPKATPSAIASTHKRNSSREPVCATACRTQGITRLPITSITATKAATLPRVIRMGRTRALEPAPPAPLRMPASAGQQHQGEDHHEVLDDQPADRDAAALGLDQPPLLQGAQQHHRTRHRQRQAEHEAGADRPAEDIGKAHAQHRGTGDLGDGAGNRDGAHRQQVLEREVQADAEHQQNDADLGQIVGEPWSAT